MKIIIKTIMNASLACAQIATSTMSLMGMYEPNKPCRLKK